LWCQYYQNGKAIRKSTGTADPKKAERFLQQRIAEVLTGSAPEPGTGKVRISALVQSLFQKYENRTLKGWKSLKASKFRWKNLELHFGHFYGSRLTDQQIESYIAHRLAANIEGATINRELALLRRALRVGKIPNIPKFPRLPENRRTGFLADALYDKLAAACMKRGLWLRAMLACSANFGFRRGELANLRMSQVSLLNRTIRLEAEHTKNGEGSLVTMTGEVFELLRKCVSRKKPGDLVFTRKDGLPVGDFRKAWANACDEAGCPRLLFHDLRRTAARNLRRLGVAEGTIMRIGGWKTRSVFDRYNIVSEDDLQDGSARQEARCPAQEPAQEARGRSDTFRTQSRTSRQDRASGKPRAAIVWARSSAVRAVDS
jgi:integrase